MLDIIKLILILVGIYIIFNVLMSLILKLTLKSVEKRLETGMMTDQQITTLYQSTSKASQRNVFQGLLFYGIFFRTQTKHNKKVTQLYENEMKKRNLLKNN